MIGALLGDFLPWIIGAISAIGGIFLYGRGQKKQGRKDAELERRMQDHQGAKTIRDQIDENRAGRSGRSAAERLRASGRLRDSDED